MDQVRIITTVLVLVVAFATINSQPKCPISLPQFVQRGSECYNSRQQSLSNRRTIYGIKEASNEVPFSCLDITIPGYAALMKTEPFLGVHALLLVTQSNLSRKIASTYLDMTSQLPTVMTLPEYTQAVQFFKAGMVKGLDGYTRLPSSFEPFQSDMTTWISDQFFAEQRLAGINPMTIQRVTFSNKIGMHWNKLKKMLNPKFDLVAAVGQSLASVLDQKSLIKAIREGYLYVLHEPICDNIPTAEEKEPVPNKKLRDYKSPISIFVSESKESGSLEKVTRFMPVAIQMDNKPDSPVFTPRDGYKWMLAKLTAQQSDMECSQVVEHLSKVHLVSEILCMCMERQLSNLHPLYAIMQYHCRGTFTTNTFGRPVLLADSRSPHVNHVFAIGVSGSNYLVVESAKIVNWKDLEMEPNIKRRGMDQRERVPYYPYRDDGKVILYAIRDMVNDYVKTYYPDDSHVKNDQEIQNYANEVSENGIGPNGGKGHLRGFPAKIESIKELVETFTQMIWLMSGQHSAISYPLADYGLYMPNEPLKLYDNDHLSGHTLPNRHVTAAGLTFQISLASFRYDLLFDYGVSLDDPNARQVLYRHFSKLTKQVEILLQERNKERHKQGHLTYPYMLPRWLTNGIQS